MVSTPVVPASPPRWRRYLSVVSALLLAIAVAPVLAFVVTRWTGLPSDVTPYIVLAVMLAVAFTLRRSWRANGFGGGLKLRWWWALWPAWVIAAPLLLLSAPSRSPMDHLHWILLSLLVGFVEEAFFRGVILRALLPGGARSAIVWSAIWFGAAHLLAVAGGYDWRMVLLLAAGAFGFGLVFAWVRIASASIWPVVIAHAFFDYSGFVDSGGLREDLRYTTYNVVISGLVAILMLAWAWWLLSRRTASLVDEETSPSPASRERKGPPELGEGAKRREGEGMPAARDVFIGGEKTRRRNMRRSLAYALGACGAALLAVSVAIAAEGAGPVFSDTGPDAAEYGAAQGYPLANSAATFEQMPYLVGSYSRFDQLARTRVVAHAATSWAFRRAAAEPEIGYRVGGLRYTIADYLQRNPVTGLLIVKDGTILYEHYQYARRDSDRFLSQSMAKTITAMLIGIAVSDGAIKSIDDAVAAYVPELAETEYGKTPIRALLHMSSGVAFNETYGGQDDLATLDRDLFGPPGKTAAASVAQFNTRQNPPGTVWHYASIETEILGLVLRAATRTPVADYLRDRIWQPIGSEADASWAIDGNGQEVTFCCFNAVLRDYARFGRLLAHDGAWEGRQIIPRQWVIDATTVRPEENYLAPGNATRFYGYGFQVWLLPGAERRFVLIGIRGQMIFVDPASKLVMVQTAIRKAPVDVVAGGEANALWSAIVQQLGGEAAQH